MRGDRVRGRRGIAASLRMVHGCLPVRERSVEVALVDVHPRQIELDPCDEGRVLARLRQRFHQRGTHTLLEIHPAHRGRAVEDLRVGGTGRRVLPGEPEQLDRLGSVAGVEVIPGGLEPSLAQPLGVLIGRSLQCELRELCGCIRRATRASVPRRFVEFGGDLCIGTDRRERQVPSTFLRVGDALGEPLMERPQITRGRRRVHGRSEQRV